MLSQGVLDEQGIPGCPKTPVRKEVRGQQLAPGLTHCQPGPHGCCLHINPALSWGTGDLAASLSLISVLSLHGKQFSHPLFTLSGQSYFHFPAWERVQRSSTFHSGGGSRIGTQPPNPALSLGTCLGLSGSPHPVFQGSHPRLIHRCLPWYEGGLGKGSNGHMRPGAGV